jgi:hypothetical protein
MVARFSKPESAPSLAAEEALRTFINLSKELHIPLGIVLFTRSSTHNSSSQLDFLAERVLELCEQEAITCVDLRSTFAGYQENPLQLWVNRFDPHPGPLAHRLSADRLMNEFGEVWLVPFQSGFDMLAPKRFFLTH